MNEEHLESVLEAFAKILNETAQLELKPGNIYSKDRSFKPHVVSVLIGLSGDVKGVVVFSFDPDVALTVTNLFMEHLGVSPSPELDEQARSALGEMVNTIMGHYMISMESRGFKVEISPPTTIVGEEVVFGLGMFQKVFGVPVDLPSGPVEITIAFQ